MKNVTVSSIVLLVMLFCNAQTAMSQPVYGCVLNEPIDADTSYSNCYVQDQDFGTPVDKISIDMFTVMVGFHAEQPRMAVTHLVVDWLFNMHQRRHTRDFVME